MVGTAGVSADAGLPPKSAQELLVRLQDPKATGLSGTVVATADLGLPTLPMGMSAGADLTSLLSGSTTLRVWLDGSGRSRVAMIGDGEESDVIRDGRDVWVWSSSAKTADHYVLPERDPARTASVPEGSPDLPSTPQDAAAMALAALDDTTAVTTSGVARVAGRPVYELVLTPRQSDTLVARVAIAVDGETNVPLRVQVFSTQLTDPAYEIGFTSVDFAQPEPSLFSFTPPPGATVSRHEGPDAESAGRPEVQRSGMDEPSVVGTGWSSVAIATIPAERAGGDDPSGAGSDAMALLEALPRTSGTWGTGRVLSGTLVSAILADDGRIAIGAVPPERLGAALAAQ